MNIPANIDLTYDETIEIMGVSIPFIPQVITPNIERPMRLNRYETGECLTAQKLLKPGDRVLELGAGVGLVSTISSRVPGIEAILTIEAHPELIPVIRETHRINNVTTVELRNGLATNADQPAQNFYVRKDFWGSSMEPDSRPYAYIAQVPAFSLAGLIEEFKPTVIIADIEGGEYDLFDGADLSGVRLIMLELHPRVYGPSGEKKILDQVEETGLKIHPDYLPGSVWVLERPAAVQVPELPSPAHRKKGSQFTVVTCMKNEGPFILEWLAYHRSIGIQNFVVFSNDCTDGSDLMLNRLDELGLITHLPNPAVVANSTYFQPTALKYCIDMPIVQRSDYVMAIDVDEFINIHVGKGKMQDLLKAAGPFHALSMSEINFGSDGNYTFSDAWVTEAFREHETKEPGHWQARRGVKTILHGMNTFSNWQAHRPIVHPMTEDQVIWLNGSGKPVDSKFVVEVENGMDRRGCYDLVTLEHHPLRSVESFLLKHDRGDVVVKNNNVNHHYYRKRSIGGQFNGEIDTHLPRARKEWQKLMSDKKLAQMHKATVVAHKKRISEIKDQPNLVEIETWIRDNYFKGVPQDN